MNNLAGIADDRLPSRPRLIALAVAAIATLAVAFLVMPGAASAGSGGVTAGGDASRDDGSRSRTAPRYERLWDNVSRHNRRWARRTSRCESGGDPNAIGGGGLYRGAFQFSKATWRTSPHSPGGDPIDYTYRTQAVVAVALKKRDGRGHWPVCG